MVQFLTTGQWASSNPLQQAPSNNVGVYVTTSTYASTNDQCLAHPLVSSSETKLCLFSSVQLRRSVGAFTKHLSLSATGVCTHKIRQTSPLTCISIVRRLTVQSFKSQRFRIMLCHFAKQLISVISPNTKFAYNVLVTRRKKRVTIISTPPCCYREKCTIRHEICQRRIGLYNLTNRRSLSATNYRLHYTVNKLIYKTKALKLICTKQIRLLIS